MSNITGKVVVITGASSGLGESTARLLAANGAKVVLGARRKDRIDSVVRDKVRQPVRHYSSRWLSFVEISDAICAGEMQ